MGAYLVVDVHLTVGWRRNQQKQKQGTEKRTEQAKKNDNLVTKTKLQRTC